MKTEHELEILLLEPICGHYTNEMFANCDSTICEGGKGKWLTLKTAEMRCETDAAGKSKATEVFPENKIQFCSRQTANYIGDFYNFSANWRQSHDAPPPELCDRS